MGPTGLHKMVVWKVPPVGCSRSTHTCTHTYTYAVQDYESDEDEDDDWDSDGDGGGGGGGGRFSRVFSLVRNEAVNRAGWLFELIQECVLHHTRRVGAMASTPPLLMSVCYY